MPTFEDWRRSYQEGVERYTKYFKETGHSEKRARELALIKQNEMIKRAQDQAGELPEPFWVDNPDYYYPGMPGLAIGGK